MLEPAQFPEGALEEADNLLSSTAGSNTNSLPDVLSNELQSLNLNAGDINHLSFPLIDENEILSIDSADRLAAKLGCDKEETPVKVLSIVGNTGDGKSYTLNHTLFEGKDIFDTSNSQESCTTGAWVAYQPCLQLVVIDTEGMLGQCASENRRTRLLMKILAISDIVIYQTKSERLHNDLFYFLADSAKTFTEHFSDELDHVLRGRRHSDEDRYGPVVILSHQTRHVLSESESSKTPEEILHDRFAQLDLDVSVLADLRYVGTNMRDDENAAHFTRLYDVIKDILDTSTRRQRNIDIVYKSVKALTQRFSSDIPSSNHRLFPDEYFNCTESCIACSSRCSKAKDHDQNHVSAAGCTFQRQYENKVFLCLRCHQRGRREVVVPKTSSANDGAMFGLMSYVWAGFVLECSSCGIIFKSRAHWYGNLDPEAASVVKTEIQHIWPGTRTLQGTHNAGRTLLDGVTKLSETVSNISAVPSKAVSSWVADQIKPDYWRPNSDITDCHYCRTRFSLEESIHHCRKCGEGFCDPCSGYRYPVPERGWLDPVRVCKRCSESLRSRGLDYSTTSDQGEIQARKIGEKVTDVMATAASVFSYPLSLVKSSARPGYWVPDEEISNCFVCQKDFDKLLRLHHCRSCGQGVCDPCSRTNRPVPARGWDTPVRVCDKCLL